MGSSSPRGDRNWQQNPLILEQPVYMFKNYSFSQNELTDRSTLKLFLLRCFKSCVTDKITGDSDDVNEFAALT